MQLSGGAKETNVGAACCGGWNGHVLCLLRWVIRQRAAVIKGRAVKRERGGRKGAWGWKSEEWAGETLVMSVTQCTSEVRCGLSMMYRDGWGG